MVAAPTALARDQAFGAQSSVASHQTPHLPSRQSPPLRSPDRLQISIRHGTEYTSTDPAPALALSPGLPRYRSPRPAKGPKDQQLSPTRRTFELSQMVA